MLLNRSSDSLSLFCVGSSRSTILYELQAVTKMMAVTSLKHWIHFRLSSLWPPTSNMLKAHHLYWIGFTYGAIENQLKVFFMCLEFRLTRLHTKAAHKRFSWSLNRGTNHIPDNHSLLYHGATKHQDTRYENAQRQRHRCGGGGGIPHHNFSVYSNAWAI